MGYKEYEKVHRQIAQAAEAESKDSAWAAEVSADLTSERFINALKPMGAEIDLGGGRVIGEALQYRTTHPGGEKFWEQVEKGHLFWKNDWSEQIIERLGISDLDDLENKRKIFEEFIKSFNETSYVFHGFNGVFEADIKRDGLDTEKRQWDWEDLKKISAIGSKAGYKMILGWSDVNSEGQIFFDNRAQHTYRYACASPEWFAQFVSEGFHIPDDPKKKQAFYRRDYDQARQNILDFCGVMMSSKPEDIKAGKAYPNISEAERQQILDFFEKYWAKFAGPNSQPKAALIKRSKVPELALPYKNFDDFCKAFDKDPDEVDIKKAISDILMWENTGIDLRLKKNVPPQDLIIVDLPEYAKLSPQD